MMNKKEKFTGLVLAAACAAVFSLAPVTSAMADAATDAGVKCSGINSCKGTGACKTADNACKGQNSCKGKGYVVAASEKECTDKGGKVEAAAPAEKPAESK
jgi:hypothetical protein